MNLPSSSCPPHPHRTQRTPLHLCSLTLTPHSNPVAAPDGVIFDASSILHLVRRTALHPLSGTPLHPTQLTHLIFSSDPITRLYRCPILLTPFTPTTKVVALATTGRVYSYQAILRHNPQPSFLRDPIESTPFTRSDLIVLYDPALHHCSTPPTPPHPPSQQSLPPLPPRHSLPLPTHTAARPISLRRPLPKPTISPQSLHRPHSRPHLFRPPSADYRLTPAAHQPPPSPLPHPTYPKPHPGPAPGPASYHHRPSPSHPPPPLKKPRHALYQPPSTANPTPTHTHLDDTPHPINSPGPDPDTVSKMQALYQKRLAEDQRKAVYKRIRKGRKGKGYVRVVTNIGHLNIELHCDKVPITCDNFLTLAERRYYDGLMWHHVVPGFIAQTGDPTGVGDAGDSAWGGFVKDEIRTSLTHDTPGVVSMANSGRDTNRSQWFVCFEAARHLDGAHTVFGKVVGGLFVLKKMESEAEMGHPLTVERVEVLVNPIRQIRDQMEKEKSESRGSEGLNGGTAASAVGSPTTTLTEKCGTNDSSFDGEQRETFPRTDVFHQQENGAKASSHASLTSSIPQELPSAKSLMSLMPPQQPGGAIRREQLRLS